MRYPHDPFDSRESSADGQDSEATIVRWSDEPGGLPLEECARRGIDAVAGLVVSSDIFGTNNYQDATFCTCAEIHYAFTGTTSNFDDYMNVNFRAVEIRDGIYPLVGPESVRMIMQPLSDGNISARWNSIDHSAGRFPRDADLTVDDLDARSGVCSPLILGSIPEQEKGDTSPPSFLMWKDPGAGWQIWRRFLHESSNVKSAGKDASREESYTMVYPMSNPHMNWRFRIYDLPGGGVRWEVDSGNRR